VVKISTQTVRIHKTNKEILTAIMILLCALIVLICSGTLHFLNVKVTSIAAREDFHYIVKVQEKTFDLVPGDVLRIERTPAKKAITGEEIEILKIYTTHGFIYARPENSYYEGARKLANSADWESLPIFTKNKGFADEVKLDQIRGVSYAIGTPVKYQAILFAVLGLQNLTMFTAGAGILLLIFPLRLEKDEEATPVASRVEQPA
jgi:hypothetical protein